MAYRGFYYMDWIGHIIMDVLCCVMIGYQLAYALRSGHTRHLRWIIPGLLSAAIATIYRIGTLIWSIARLPYPAGSRYTLLFVLDVQEITTIIGYFALTSLLISGKFDGGTPTTRQSPPGTGHDDRQWPPQPQYPGE